MTAGTADADVLILADHSVWIAVPAFAPAIVVAGVVVYIAMKNRRKREARTDGESNT
ncbi:hypothetical protein [Mycobacterium sp. 1164985.4]|uniref:hypothetical protein n=1 Tax=Mycobacterium sp. 1164985.4 TaxID=1834069 RepID=UPI000AAD0B91|nr:hypothetical protein [Mycobacterium sp. 1164985.4]